MAKRVDAACPDCPAARQGVLRRHVPSPSEPRCEFDCLRVAARQPLPERWFDGNAVGLVRRGVVIRERVDAQGRAAAVDAAGPGSAFFLRDPLIALRACQRVTAACKPRGYAATDVLVCLLPTQPLAQAFDADRTTAHDLLLLQTHAIERLERLAEARAHKRIESRVATLLLALADTLCPLQQRDRMPAGLQQRDLAHLVAARHETVCRVLGTLEQDGAIAREVDGLRILNRELLQRV